MSSKNYQLDRSMIYELFLSLFRLKNDKIIQLEDLELEKEIKLDKEIANWAAESLEKIPQSRKK